MQRQGDELPLGGQRRSALRRFAEVRGLVGGHRMPHEHVELRAQDGVEIAATFLPGPAGAPALVQLHGFGAHRRKPSYAGFADALAERFSVLAIDLRGHGQSGGRSSLGDREVLDAEAALAWLRDRGHRWVAAVGISMGATTAVHTLVRDAPPDAVVAISSPAHLHPEPRTEPMRRLHQLWTSPPHRAGLRVVTGVRVVPVSQWSSPPHPAEVVPGASRPTLVVHGEDDHFFDVDEWRAAIGDLEAVPLWTEPPGFGHAEDGLTRAFAHRVASAIEAVHAHGRFPRRDEVAV